MEKEYILAHHQSFLAEVENYFHGKKQGYGKIVTIGPKLFPYTIPPQLEMVLLDPEDQTLAFRVVTAPEAMSRKKGEWVIGKPLDAVACVLMWAGKMKKTAPLRFPREAANAQRMA
jgi:hypothetical protein